MPGAGPVSALCSRASLLPYSPRKLNHTSKLTWPHYGASARERRGEPNRRGKALDLVAKAENRRARAEQNVRPRANHLLLSSAAQSAKTPRYASPLCVELGAASACCRGVYATRPSWRRLCVCFGLRLRLERGSGSIHPSRSSAALCRPPPPGLTPRLSKIRRLTRLFVLLAAALSDTRSTFRYGHY
jgi:hypothetical protein